MGYISINYTRSREKSRILAPRPKNHQERTEIGANAENGGYYRLDKNKMGKEPPRRYSLNFTGMRWEEPYIKLVMDFKGFPKHYGFLLGSFGRV